MKNFFTVTLAIGIVVLFIGMGSGESENFLIPLGLIIFGGLLMGVSAYFLRPYYPGEWE